MKKSTTGQIQKYSGYKTPAQVTIADYQDAGVDYESYVRTADMDFGDPFAEKHGSHFEVVFDDSFSTDTTISIQRDIDVGDIDVQPNLNISSAVLTLPFVFLGQEKACQRSSGVPEMAFDQYQDPIGGEQDGYTPNHGCGQPRHH
jgi:hypothetical protein